MKKLLFAALGLLSVSAIQAQTRADNSGFRFGLKGGANFTAAKYTSPVGYKYEASLETGYYGGGLVEFSFPAGSKFKLQSELLYNKAKFDNEFENATTKFTNKTDLTQVSIPVFAKYFVTPAFSLNAGFSGNFNLKAENELTVLEKATNHSTKTNGEWNKNNLNTFQPGALVGAEVYVHEGLFIDARYNFYLSDPYKKTSTSLQTDYKDMHGFQVGIGYKF